MNNTTTNINTQNNDNNENTNVYLTDAENKYLLNEFGDYLIANDKKENEIMPNTKKYVSLDKLGLYDEKIKKVITDGDTAALDTAKSYADSLASSYDSAGAAATAKSAADAAQGTANAHAGNIGNVNEYELFSF